MLLECRCHCIASGAPRLPCHPPPSASPVPRRSVLLLLRRSPSVLVCFGARACPARRSASRRLLASAYLPLPLCLCPLVFARRPGLLLPCPAFGALWSASCAAPVLAVAGVYVQPPFGWPCFVNRYSVFLLLSVRYY